MCSSFHIFNDCAPSLRLHTLLDPGNGGVNTTNKAVLITSLWLEIQSNLQPTAGIPSVVWAGEILGAMYLPSLGSRRASSSSSSFLLFSGPTQPYKIGFFFFHTEAFKYWGPCASEFSSHWSGFPALSHLAWDTFWFCYPLETKTANMD